MKITLPSFLVAISAYLLLSTGCAVNPRCPGSLLPIVEVQVNNTPSNHDDYGSTASFTGCRARITNYAKLFGGYNFPGGVSVEIRNPNSTTNLVFTTSSSATTGSSSIFAVLPQDGSWLNFYTEGTTTSTIDKSISIEMATAGSCSEVVLARKAMMVPAGSPPISPTASLPRVELELGSVATLDDYITWSPTPCRIRWTSGTAGATLGVTLQNMAGANRINFADSNLPGGNTATNPSLALTLKGDASWVSFYIAGNYPNSSINDKDAVLEVIQTTGGALVSREGLMVRIRKNADSLSVAERNRYLEALQKIDLTYNNYIDFVRTHSRDNTGSGGSVIAHKQAHSGSAFLPWHRIFILHLERLLQASDPSVAIPYWRFDINAQNVFSSDFFGSNTTGTMANLSATNPIVSWNLPLESVPTGIQRHTPYGDNGHPTVSNEMADMALGGTTFAFGNSGSVSGFRTMEIISHNPAHSTSGLVDAGGNPLPGASWIAGSPAIADRDPLFFSLHCNVDRLWSKWQWIHTRYTPTDPLSYDLQGSLTAPAAGVATPNVAANRMLGQYADDTMWPWDNVTGGTIGSTSERPNIAILTPLPITIGSILPGSKPTVKSAIDYLNITNTRPVPTLGFAYDDFFPY